MKATPVTIKAAVAARCGGVCEVCGRRQAQQPHHRRPRGMGGSQDAPHRLSNLLGLCALCHDGIESHREGALIAGWLVPQHRDPAEVWVESMWGPVWLADDGTVTPVE